LHPIKKLHIFDAMNLLQHSRKKVAKLMVRTFYNIIDHAKQRGFNPVRLWVHGCLIGKTKRYKGVRYHAKGRGCREKKDFCQVKIILYEKSAKQFF
jgi:ribosomal protein L22